MKKINLNFDLIFIIVVFTLGFFIRFLSIYPDNIIIGFDQARDLFLAQSIYQNADLKIIGPTAGNNPNLHHGVLYIYYLLPPLILFNGNPIAAALWNSIFNAFLSVILFFFALSLFRNKLTAITAAILAAVSYQLVQYSGWLSNPTVTLFTVPFFYFCLWQFISGRKNFLISIFITLGLSIQFQLFFIYLIPIMVLTYLIFSPKLPSYKIITLSFIGFILTTLTMILTEIKYGFAGVLAVLGAGEYVGGQRDSFAQTFSLFLTRVYETFSNNIYPDDKNSLGFILCVLTLSIIALNLFLTRDKQLKKALIFVLIYLASPLIMLVLGYHNAPWFLIGLPAAVILGFSYALSRIPNKVVVMGVLIALVFVNLSMIKKSLGEGQRLLEPDQAALLKTQLQVIDYTYKSSENKPFLINTLTNPLYINALWAYHYPWYGAKKYGYLPTWGGGDQLYPYGTLMSEKDNEEYLYLIIDTTPRIPPIYTENLINWADKISTFKEEKKIGGLLVQKRLITKSSN